MSLAFGAAIYFIVWWIVLIIGIAGTLIPAVFIPDIEGKIVFSVIPAITKRLVTFNRFFARKVGDRIVSPQGAPLFVDLCFQVLVGSEVVRDNHYLF